MQATWRRTGPRRALRVVAAALAGAAFLALPGASPRIARAGAVPSWAQPSFQGMDTSANVLAVLPPGEDALAPAAQGSHESPYATDQVAPYANLIHGLDGLTNAGLDRYFHPETIGIAPSAIVRTEHPSASEPVVVYRDALDVPHIYAADSGALAWGAGWVSAEDHLFSMDVLRHYGSGTLADFAGPSCTFEQMDFSELTETGYTTAQLQAMLDRLSTEGPVGRQVLAMIHGYVAGVNAYISKALLPANRETLLPVEYAALGANPQPWSPTDVLAVMMVVSPFDGQGGGGELADAALQQYLEAELGSAAGMAAWQDFREQNDPDTPVTVTKPYPYMLVPAHVDPSLSAVPDHPGAPLTGTMSEYSPGCSDPPPPRIGVPVAEALAPMLAFNTKTSNAILVSSKLSADGHPIAVFGPQVNYYAPSVFVEEDLHAPGIDAAGMALAGMSFVIVFGRGRNYAWSGTSSGADDVDTRVEKLCNPSGGAVAAMSAWYVYDGRCRAMSHHQVVEHLKPNVVASGAPGTLVHDVYQSVHGVVQGWTTLGGAPVAIALQRAANGHEADAFVGLVRWMEPSLTHDPASWLAGAESCPWALNWYYVDSHHIAYYSGGLLPLRPPGEDPNLPTWGTGIAEWRGWLSAAAHPQEVDPASGIIINWNNASAPGFSASTGDFSHSPVYRSQLLTNALSQQLAAHHGKLTRADVVVAMGEAATTDMSASGVLPELLRYLGGSSSAGGSGGSSSAGGSGGSSSAGGSGGSSSADPHVAEMVSLLRSWVAAGSHRITATGDIPPGADQQYEDAAAIAIWDEAYPLVLRAAFDPLFASGGVTTYQGIDDGYTVFPEQFAATPNGYGTHAGDSYGGGFEGYLWRVLRQAQGERVAEPFSPGVAARLCGGGIATCRDAFAAALRTAYARLVAANGAGTDPATWTADSATVAASEAAGHTVTMPVYDEIQFTGTGLAGAPAMNWENRPTFQQVAEFDHPIAPLSTSATAAGAGVLAIAVLGVVLAAFTGLAITIAGVMLRRRERRRR